MKYALVILFAFLSVNHLFSQNISDTTLPGNSDTLETVTIRAFEQRRSNGPVQVLYLRNNEADRGNKLSLVSGLNTLPGIRMEERSPGSYRINIRGSSLRSPFGVRNVKVYWNGIPVTDPGGNTYFNQFALNNFSSMEIVKGPAGSLYGAGTGGLILMHSLDDWKPGVSAEYMTGSYGLQQIFGSVQFGSGENKNLLTFAHNQSDGYRVQSSVKRDNFSYVSQAQWGNKNLLTASLLYTNLEYQTPGPLTAAEYAANPAAARPAAGGLPSAVNAKATIYQKNLLAGLTNHVEINADFSNTTVLYGSFAQIKNPAIRNYERRQEPHFGGRSFFTFKQDYSSLNWQFIAGGELQEGFFNTQVSKNRQGNPDTLQTNDDTRYTTYSVFAQADAEINRSWMINAGISVNQTKVSITRLSSYPVTPIGRTYRNEYAPRISLLKKLSDRLSLIATVSKGFSPPTIAELLPSTSAISTNLEAESGINYELTARSYLLQRALHIEVTGFYFKLNNALVQRKDGSGADYYINAGDTKQKGLEVSADYNKHFSGNAILRSMQIRGGYTLHDFTY
ncbi:MAG TPA: TonB-dependent receptor, partial [Flavitalea sp.]|nr:TonB-dependent receptor [Flavitalea sp.]